MFFDSWSGVGRVVVVGVLAYTALVFSLRLSGSRSLAKMNAFDLVVTVALGSTLATIILSKDVALLEGVVAFVVLIGLQFVVTWLSVRSGAVRKMVKNDPVLIAHDGAFLDRSMRRARVNRGEVLAALRDKAMARIEEAGAVILENDGTLTVLPRDAASARVLRDVRDLSRGADPDRSAGDGAGARDP